MSTAKREVEILNEAGMHLRPAAAFVQTANKHKECEVQVSHSGQRVNGKSIMGLVMLAAGKGTVLAIECSGNDAEAALEELCNLVNSKFGAEE
ncbi:MAG: HPr family phosphocarrier protein [Candidatus Sumerlaeaceae bacterium]